MGPGRNGCHEGMGVRPTLLTNEGMGVRPTLLTNTSKEHVFLLSTV